MIRIMFLGEIVGLPVVKMLRKKLTSTVNNYAPDLVIANGDGASDGYGILAETANDIFASGVQVITTGDLVYNKKNMKEYIDENPHIVRPQNLPENAPGRGTAIYTTDMGVPVAVVSLLGRTNFNKIFPSDPYRAGEHAVDALRKKTPLVIVDFHGGTTSEIQSMQWFLAGKATAVIGTHARVLTGDQRVIENHTAVVSGAGMCGGLYSIGGFDPEIEIQKIVTGRFAYSKIEKEQIYLQGVLIEADENTGAAQSITLINEPLV